MFLPSILNYLQSKLRYYIFNEFKNNLNLKIDISRIDFNFNYGTCTYNVRRMYIKYEKVNFFAMQYLNQYGLVCAFSAQMQIKENLPTNKIKL